MKRQIGLGIALVLPLVITAWGCNGEQIESGVKSTGTKLEKAGGAIESGTKNLGEKIKDAGTGSKLEGAASTTGAVVEKSGEKTREVLDKTGEKLKEVAPAAGKAVEKAGEKLKDLKHKTGEKLKDLKEKDRRQTQRPGRQGQRHHQEGDRQELIALPNRSRTAARLPGAVIRCQRPGGGPHGPPLPFRLGHEACFLRRHEGHQLLTEEFARSRTYYREPVTGDRPEISSLACTSLPGSPAWLPVESSAAKRNNRVCSPKNIGDRLAE